MLRKVKLSKMLKVAYIELKFPCWKVCGMTSLRLQCLCCFISITTRGVSKGVWRDLYSQN